MRHIRDWAKYGKGLQQMFAVHTLARLPYQYLHETVDLLLELDELSEYQKDFWLARIIIFTIKELFEKKQQDIKLSSKERDKLRGVVQKYAKEARDPFIRGTALATLPFLSNQMRGRLIWVTEQMRQETWSWSLWNLAYGLREWNEHWDDREGAWIWQILNELAENQNQHIRYAVDRTVAILKKRNEEEARKIALKLRGNLWRAVLRDGISDFSKMNQLGIIYAPVYLEPAYDNHIECRERLQSMLSTLEEKGIDKNGKAYFNWITPRLATQTQLKWVHHTGKKSDEEDIYLPGNDFHRDGRAWSDYVETLQRESKRIETKEASRQQTGPSELRFESYEVALRSVGGVLDGIDYVMKKSRAKAAFSLNRPPGHLANNTICLFNNIAIGAYYARYTYNTERILIVDCDAHQGKHTNQVFLEDSNTIYFSMHIDNDYTRESGTVKHTGKGKNKGYNFNLPYPEYMPDDGYKYMIDNLLIPLAKEFKPELIMISAGYDGHFDDKLTPDCILSDGAYLYLAEKLNLVAKNLGIGVVGAIEGGYGLTGMANSFVHMVSVFGDWPNSVREKIGFTPLPEDYNQKYGKESETYKEALEKVKTLVKERVELMRKVQQANSEYLFDTSLSHWQDILNG